MQSAFIALEKGGKTNGNRMPCNLLKYERRNTQKQYQTNKSKKGDMLLIMSAKSTTREVDKKIEELIEERLGAKALVLPTGLEIEAVIESGT